MRPEVSQFFRTVLAAELFETVKASRNYKDEKLFRHMIVERKDLLIFCALFPKADVLAIPGLPEDFTRTLSIFNLLGVVTNGEDNLDLTVLAVRGKPFTRIESAEELAGALDDARLQLFLGKMFTALGYDVDLEQLDFGPRLELLASALAGSEVTPQSVAEA